MFSRALRHCNSRPFLSCKPSIEIQSMNRSMLSVFSAVLLCAQSALTFAADSTSSTPATGSDQQIRTQVEAKRDQLSGADKIKPAQQQSSSSMLDAPVDTDDAPAQAQRP
ncbi:hypothetical protein ALP78_100618 [Pseudomonas coronafaciens pv. striafaciens]|uniref:PAS protein n=2 Tax=Pseudomonas TaxID=286 RepID=A0A3M4Y7T9_9PSED|nr:hypothetical protein ALP78_100618 [Pseudomonas coronafaciens pv. striafaciens]